MGFVGYMSTSTGRAARVGVGLVMMVAGVLVGGAAGWVVAATGVVPMAAGLANVCWFAPLFHAPFRGRQPCLVTAGARDGGALSLTTPLGPTGRYR